MQVPAAEMIEAAADQLADAAYRAKHAWVWPAQLASVRSAIPGQTDEFYRGYELGLQTARVELAELPAAVIAKISI